VPPIWPRFSVSEFRFKNARLLSICCTLWLIHINTLEIHWAILSLKYPIDQKSLLVSTGGHQGSRV
jgi:hypothetical protein